MARPRRRLRRVLPLRGKLGTSLSAAGRATGGDNLNRKLQNPGLNIEIARWEGCLSRPWLATLNPDFCRVERAQKQSGGMNDAIGTPVAAPARFKAAVAIAPDRRLALWGSWRRKIR